jgi:hypothetical protein
MMYLTVSKLQPIIRRALFVPYPPADPMAQAAYVSEPRKNTNNPPRNIGYLLLAGGLLALVLSVAHPQGGAPHVMAGEFTAWTTVHVLGAIGIGLIAIAALLLLTGGQTATRSQAFALAGLTLAAFATMLTMAIDGFLNPALATMGGEQAGVVAAFVEIERAFASFSFGAFGIFGALLILTHFAGLGTPMKIAAVIGVIGHSALAIGGIVYIGMGVTALGPTMAGTLLVFAWYTLWGARIAFTRAPATTASQMRARAA